MRELWSAIDRLDHHIKVTEGKETDPTLKPLTRDELYAAKHNLIDLRRQQFYLRDSVKPVVCAFGVSAKHSNWEAPDPIDWENYYFFPLGLKPQTPSPIYELADTTAGARNNLLVPEAKIFDFTNPEHIYELIKAAADLECDPTISIGNQLLEALDFYTELADLSAAHLDILRLKKYKHSNEQICEFLYREYGLTHNPNYISTIFKKKICGGIAAAVTLYYDKFLARHDTNRWKLCTTCGEWKLLDPREFTRKKRSADGFSGQCKLCEKAARDKKKRQKEEEPNGSANCS